MTESAANSPAPAAPSSTSSTPDTVWCDARRQDVLAYLERTNTAHGRVGDVPAFYALPYLSIWAVESQHRPEWIGFWVICGDLPSDALPAQGLDTPRDAMRAFGKRWLNHAQTLEGGEVPNAWRHLPEGELYKLAATLRKRGDALKQWADNDEAWPATGEPADREED